MDLMTVLAIIGGVYVSVQVLLSFSRIAKIIAKDYRDREIGKLRAAQEMSMKLAEAKKTLAAR